MNKENKNVKNSDALKGFLLNFCHAHRYKNVGQALPDNKGSSCPPCGGSYKNVGQARPDNAPSKKHPSVLIMGKDTLCCQVKPDLHSRLTTRKGFTLIELLVVVLIIGILAAVALPQYQKAVRKARLSQLDVTINALTKAIDVYVLENGYQEIFFTGNKENESLSYADLDITALSCDSNTQTECINKHGTWAMECLADLYCRIEIFGYGANYKSVPAPFGDEIYFYKYLDQHNQQWTFEVLDHSDDNLKLLCQWAKGKFIFETDAASECARVGI